MLDSTPFLILLVAIGFGFVVFWHELGHFLAAKWAGVRVEQFAIGFGQAIISYRRGLGLRVGTSTPEYEKIIQARQSGAADAATGEISPTEYRLNWIPLGGYVKMYGQEDLVASTTSTDTDHYMNKPVGKRMVIISAGVVMNIILAAILFTVLYFIGYHPPAPVVGVLVPGGPAEAAGIQVGDRILQINEQPQYNWMNVSISTALLKPEKEVPVLVQPAGTEGELAQRLYMVRPEAGMGPNGMVGIGIERSYALKGVDPKFVTESEEKLRQLFSPAAFAVRPGEAVVELAGQPVNEADWWRLWRALHASSGEPVPARVQTLDGQIEDRQITPLLVVTDEDEQKALAGLQPLVQVTHVQNESPSAGKLMPGDVVERITVSGTADTVATPSLKQMRNQLKVAGERGATVDLVVRRGGERVELEGLEVIVIDREDSVFGLAFMPGVDTTSTTLGGVREDSAAAEAGVPSQGRVVAVDDQPVDDWFEIASAMKDAAIENRPVSLAVEKDGDVQRYSISLAEGEWRQGLIDQPVTADLPFVQMPVNHLKTVQKTRNPIQAMGWGLRETKDQVVQLYLTLKRVAIDRTVSPKNLTGPVGIFQFGTIVARQGPEWLLWFLAIISANLAVVNFLPIPILDGGHMVFLATEKITGKPPSPQVQTAALYAGLLLIVGLVLFVTYNDIQRLTFLQ